jgi:hypothetical protein
MARNGAYLPIAVCLGVIYHDDVPIENIGLYVRFKTIGIW